MLFRSELHPVEPGPLRIFGGFHIIGDHPWNLAQLERPRHFIVTSADRRVRLARCLGRRCRDGWLAVIEHRMDDAAHVPERGDDAATLLVDGLGHRLPALALSIGPSARRPRPPNPTPLA